MMVQRNDVPHFTPGEVEAVLVSALELVTQLDVPTHMQPAVFTQAASMLAAKTIQLKQPQQLAGGVVGLGRMPA